MDITCVTKHFNHGMLDRFVRYAETSTGYGVLKRKIAGIEGLKEASELAYEDSINNFGEDQESSNKLIQDESAVLNFFLPRMHFLEVFASSQTASWYEALFAIFWGIGVLFSLFESEQTKLHAVRYIVAAGTSFATSIIGVVGVISPNVGVDITEKLSKKFNEWKLTPDEIFTTNKFSKRQFFLRLFFA